MFYLFVYLVNSPFIILGFLFLVGLITVYLLDKFRALIYQGLMDVLSLRQAYITQQLDLKEKNARLEAQIETVQQALQANRLKLTTDRHKLLNEIDAQFSMELIRSKSNTQKVEM
jgi:hypothetical protein